MEYKEVVVLVEKKFDERKHMHEQSIRGTLYTVVSNNFKPETDLTIVEKNDRIDGYVKNFSQLSDNTLANRDSELETLKNVISSLDESEQKLVLMRVLDLVDLIEHTNDTTFAKNVRIVFSMNLINEFYKDVQSSKNIYDGRIDANRLGFIGFKNFVKLYIDDDNKRIDVQNRLISDFDGHINRSHLSFFDDEIERERLDFIKIKRKIKCKKLSNF